MTYKDIVRFGGDCQVCTYRGEALLCHCRCRCNCRSHKRLHRHEQRGTGREEENHDGRGRMYFLNRCRTSTSDVLRYRRINLPHDERQGRTLP